MKSKATTAVVESAYRSELANSPTRARTYRPPKIVTFIIILQLDYNLKSPHISRHSDLEYIAYTSAIVRSQIVGCVVLWVINIGLHEELLLLL